MYLWLSFVGQFFFFLKMYLTFVNLSFPHLCRLPGSSFFNSELQSYSSKFTPLKIVISQIPFHFPIHKLINYFKMFAFKHNSLRSLECLYREHVDSYWGACEHTHNSIVHLVTL